MKKLNFEKLKGKKGAFIGLVFFVGLVAMGAALFMGGSVSEVPQVVGTAPVPPSDVPSNVTPASADPGSQDNSDISGYGSASLAKKYYSNDGYSTKKPVGVQAATETEIHHNPPSTDISDEEPIPDDDEDLIEEPDEEDIDPGDVEIVDDDEEIPDDLPSDEDLDDWLNS